MNLQADVAERCFNRDLQEFISLVEKQYTTLIKYDELQEVVDTKATKSDVETTQYRITKQETIFSNHIDDLYKKIDEI